MYIFFSSLHNGQFLCVCVRNIVKIVARSSGTSRSTDYLSISRSICVCNPVFLFDFRRDSFLRNKTDSIVTGMSSFIIVGFVNKLSGLFKIQNRNFCPPRQWRGGVYWDVWQFNVRHLAAGVPTVIAIRIGKIFFQMGTKKGKPKITLNRCHRYQFKDSKFLSCFSFRSACFITLPKSNPRNSNFKA